MNVLSGCCSAVGAKPRNHAGQSSGPSGWQRSACDSGATGAGACTLSVPEYYAVPRYVLITPAFARGGGASRSDRHALIHTGAFLRPDSLGRRQFTASISDSIRLGNSQDHKSNLKQLRSDSPPLSGAVIDLRNGPRASSEAGPNALKADLRRAFFHSVRECRMRSC